METSVLPGYIRRQAEEEQLIEESALVRRDGNSRVVLLYGDGGVGKTQLVRYLLDAKKNDPHEVWVDPVDIDDPHFWLLSNLERHVAERIDPDGRFFGQYMDYLSRLPTIVRPQISHATVVSHLGRIKRVFAECYGKFIAETGKTVVITFDTVETIRGMYLLQTLTQWIKSLPGTLFILVGRPAPAVGDAEDPIRHELVDPHQKMPVRTIELGDFNERDATSYLDEGRTHVQLADAEKVRLVLLTRGHPLWLALTVNYLQKEGLPVEAEAGPPEQVAESLAHLRQIMPLELKVLQGEALSLYESFKGRLVAPFQNSDFWHQAVKRLAVVRESIDQHVWEALMSDQPPPAEAEYTGGAWQYLQNNEWIRPRANRRYLTLHDALAEELAEGLIPLHDSDKKWRREMWRRAADIYARMTAGTDERLRDKLDTLDENLRTWSMNPAPRGDVTRPLGLELDLIKEAARLDAEKRQLHQARAIGLYYEILCDPDRGTSMFLSTFGAAKKDHDILFMDLLAFEMQRFLPGGADAFNDVIKEEVEQFRLWLLTRDGRPRYLEIALSMADYFIRAEMPARALALLDERLELIAGPEELCRISNLRGNAYMRIPDEVSKGEQHFEDALGFAQRSTSPTKHKLIAAAYKELGFYYRNVGRWDRANESYGLARSEISKQLSPSSPDEDREEMASIQTNWAYVKGLSGHYRDGINLVESAINVRRRLKKRQEEGISWSVCGEIYRYERRFQNAWAAYAEAEQIFQDLRNWAWLGFIYQEQAICLFQASQDGITLTKHREQVDQAKRLITLALDLCADLAIRGYPSALNRAGRIFGADEADKALSYLKLGIDQAYRLSDAWFWLANLVEYVELCYQTWVKTADPRYRAWIEERSGDIARAGPDEDAFPDLHGRWRLTQGHLYVHDWFATGDEAVLRRALEEFKRGFLLIAESYVGSSGSSAGIDEFKRLTDVIWGLPQNIRAEWHAEFQRAWSDQGYRSTLLLARLEELY